MSRSIQRPLIGTPAPPIALTDAHGNLWSLAEQSGKQVVVIFHRHIH